MTKEPNILSVRVGGAGGTVYHNVRLHGSGGLCPDREAAIKLLEKMMRRRLRFCR